MGGRRVEAGGRGVREPAHLCLSHPGLLATPEAAGSRKEQERREACSNSGHFPPAPLLFLQVRQARLRLTPPTDKKLGDRQGRDLAKATGQRQSVSAVSQGAPALLTCHLSPSPQPQGTTFPGCPFCFKRNSTGTSQHKRSVEKSLSITK